MTLVELFNLMSHAVERARHYGAMARDALGVFPASPWKHALIDVVDSCVASSH